MEPGRRRLRSCFANMGPGGPGVTVRPYYEGLPTLRAGRGADEGGEIRRIVG